MASRMSPTTRTAALAGGWLLAAVLATGAGMFAVGAIGDDIAPEGQQPFGAAKVAALAKDTRPTTAPTSTRNEAGGNARLLTSAGGNVVARCSGNRVEIVSASPAQGFQVDERDHGLDDSAEVKFTNGGTEVKVEARCVNGIPRSSAERKTDDERTEAPDTDDHGDDDNSGRGHDGDDDGGGHGGHGGGDDD